MCWGVQSLRRSSALLAGHVSCRWRPELTSSATVAATVVDVVGEGVGRGSALVTGDWVAPASGAQTGGRGGCRRCAPATSSLSGCYILGFLILNQ
jgi:hypothetical protein